MVYLAELFKGSALIILINIASIRKAILMAVLTYDSIFYIMVVGIEKYPDTLNSWCDY